MPRRNDKPASSGKRKTPKPRDEHGRGTPKPVSRVSRVRSSSRGGRGR